MRLTIRSANRRGVAQSNGVTLRRKATALVLAAFASTFLLLLLLLAEAANAASFVSLPSQRGRRQQRHNPALVRWGRNIIPASENKHGGSLDAPVASSSSSSSSLLATASSGEIPGEWQGQVLRELKQVIDPDLGSDIVALGFVQNLQLDDDDDDDRVVSFDVELTTPACPVKDQFREDCKRLVEALDWVDRADVTMTAVPPGADNNNGGADVTVGMSGVSSVIAVSSCKGGVGKSTTAVNLAFALQQLGASVGILDTDVYGPSLPTMVAPDDDIVRFVGRQIAPLQRNGVKLMSFGYINEGSAVMRGPIVTQLLDQFMSVVHWGALDYLILDFPPGTGDIPLTLTQRLNITAAVIVTTPQELSFADVIRGVEMFDSVQVPAVAVVENMAYFQVPPPSSQRSSSSSEPRDAVVLDRSSLKRAIAERLASESSSLVQEESPNGSGGAREAAAASMLDPLAEDLVEIVLREQQRNAEQPRSSAKEEEEQEKEEPEKIRIFGPGHKHRLANQWGIDHTFSMPLLNTIASNGDSGTPFVLENPDTPQAEVYRDLAKAVVSEVAKVKYAGGSARPQIIYDAETHTIQVTDNQKRALLPSRGPQDGNSDGSSDSGDDQRQHHAQQEEPQILSPATLRRACRCAMCVEEMTGRQILVAADVPESIKPSKMSPTGNYALSVDWSDGHRSLYPYRQIRGLLLQEEQEQEQQQQRDQEQTEAVEQSSSSSPVTIS